MDVRSVIRVAEFLYAIRLVINAEKRLTEADWIELDKVVEYIKEGQDSKHQ